jgi:peptide-methionine (S)-S-oxide reductase
MRGVLSRALGFAVLGALLAQAAACAGNAPQNLAAPVRDNPKAAGPPQTAVLAGGCFWGVQGVFEHVRGVRHVIAGYAGGDRKTAEYETVSSGRTGHAESVEITFDPAIVSYGEILQVFFAVAHDPTQLNRQESDVGTQYRSEIFYADDMQREIAQAYIAQLGRAHVFERPIVTKLEPLKGLYPAEDYHQDFLFHNPHNSYIAFYDLPKIENLRRVLPSLYVTDPVLVASSVQGQHR